MGRFALQRRSILLALLLGGALPLLGCQFDRAGLAVGAVAADGRRVDGRPTRSDGGRSELGSPPCPALEASRAEVAPPDASPPDAAPDAARPDLPRPEPTPDMRACVPSCAGLPCGDRDPTCSSVCEPGSGCHDSEIFTVSINSNLAPLVCGYCNDSDPFSLYCRAAAHTFCSNYGWASGIGPEEVTGDTMVILCVAPSAASAMLVPWSTLTPFNAGCAYAYSAGFTINCNFAAHYYCASLAGFASGFGVLAADASNALVTCVRSGFAEVPSGNFAELQGYLSYCDPSNPFTAFCSAAINRDCQARAMTSGWGIISVMPGCTTSACPAVWGCVTP